MKTSLVKYNKFIDDCGEEEPDFEKSWYSGWIACKDEILKILNKPQKNCDLSEDNCDYRYIEEISKL